MLPKQEKLEQFLHKEDYLTLGDTFGYEGHAQTDYTNRLNAIKAKFRRLVQELIDELKEELLTIEIAIEDTGDFTIEKSKLQLQLKRINEQVNFWEAQRELDLDTNTGSMFCEVRESFHAGYAQGMTRFNTRQHFGRMNGIGSLVN